MKGIQHHTDDFSKAFESAFASLQVGVEAACAAEDEWPAQIAAGIRAALYFAASNPAAAQALTTDALAAGRQGFVRYDRMIAYFGDLLLPGLALRPEGERLPEITGRAMAGGVATLVTRRLEEGLENELLALASEAVQFVLTPYLGAEWAAEVAAK